MQQFKKLLICLLNFYFLKFLILHLIRCFCKSRAGSTQPKEKLSRNMSWVENIGGKMEVGNLVKSKVAMGLGFMQWRGWFKKGLPQEKLGGCEGCGVRREPHWFVFQEFCLLQRVPRFACGRLWEWSAIPIENIFLKSARRT